MQSNLVLLFLIFLDFKKVSCTICYFSNIKNITWREPGHNLKYEYGDCKSDQFSESLHEVLDLLKKDKLDPHEDTIKVILRCFIVKISLKETHVIDLVGCIPEGKCETLTRKIFQKLRDQKVTLSLDNMHCDECWREKCNRPSVLGFPKTSKGPKCTLSKVAAMLVAFVIVSLM